MKCEESGGSGVFLFFFFNDTATTEIYTLSLHDALPISDGPRCLVGTFYIRLTKYRRYCCPAQSKEKMRAPGRPAGRPGRSEEHTSELQSRQYLVCRLLLEKKKNT